jgi:hypothetical protein
MTRMLRSLLITLCAVLLISVPRSSTDAFLGFMVTNPPFTSLTYGIQAFLGWDNGWAGTHVAWIQLMGFSHVKQTCAWEDIEPQPGAWQFERADAILDELERRNLRWSSA